MKNSFFPLVFLCFLLFSFSVQASEVQIAPDFTLGPGDVLNVSVWKDEALTKEVLIRPDGRFSFPLAGEIMATGRTVEEVRDQLESKLKKYVPDSPVTVVLTQLQSTRIYVVGKVRNSGVYTVQGGINILQALALAGGLDRFADKDDIYVLRQTTQGQNAIPFDYSKVTRGQDLSSNIFLKPGDTVIVP